MYGEDNDRRSAIRILILAFAFGVIVLGVAAFMTSCGVVDKMQEMNANDHVPLVNVAVEMAVIRSLKHEVDVTAADRMIRVATNLKTQIKRNRVTVSNTGESLLHELIESDMAYMDLAIMEHLFDEIQIQFNKSIDFKFKSGNGQLLDGRVFAHDPISLSDIYDEIIESAEDHAHL